MRILLMAAFIVGHVQSAAATEVATEAKVLEVDGTTLRELRAGAGTGLIANVSEGVARSLVEGAQSRMLQSVRLTIVDEGPVHLRVSSQVGSLDVGLDFELTARVSVKREIKLTVISQMEVRRRDNESDSSLPVFTGESVHQEITTAEGSSILVAGFLTEREAGQLASMETLRDSPMLKSLFNEGTPSGELVLILTPHVVRAPGITGVTWSAAPPPPLPGRYTVQVGAFQNQANASALLAELEKRHQDVFIQESFAGKRFYRVRVGRFANLQEVQQLESQLRGEGFMPFVSQLR